MQLKIQHDALQSSVPTRSRSPGLEWALQGVWEKDKTMPSPLSSTLSTCWIHPRPELLRW